MPDDLIGDSKWVGQVHAVFVIRLCAVAPFLLKVSLKYTYWLMQSSLSMVAIVVNFTIVPRSMPMKTGRLPGVKIGTRFSLTRSLLCKQAQDTQHTN